VVTDPFTIAETWRSTSLAGPLTITSSMNATDWKHA
jgi:hypothetical protein